MSSAVDKVVRPVAAFPDGIWDDCFLEPGIHDMEMEAYAMEMNLLKEEVRVMLVDDTIDHKEKMDLINVVDRLGLSYHFAEEISDQLNCIFRAYNYQNNYDLYTVSTHFRVFRQHGFNIHSDLFSKFMNSHGMLQDKLKSDVRGILSLYEAAHMGMCNEEFMDEALEQTTSILHSIAYDDLNSGDESLHNQVVHATKQALHFGIKRVEIGHFIGFCEKDESQNATLLRLAKLDFNILQQQHRQELCEIVKWWDELDVKNQLPYARNRCAEGHFWAVGMYSEPCYYRGRIFLAKLINMVSTLDDTYDAYGTIEELGLLTQAFERWDKDDIEELSGKMKIMFNYVFNLFEEYETAMVNEGRGFVARYAKAAVIELIKCYYTEANWAHQRYIPSVEEYMSKAAETTSVSQMIITIAMMGMEADIANEKAFNWVVNPVPRAVRCVEIIGRLMNDIASHQDEQKRSVHVASAVECYMKEHGSNEDEAVAKLREMVRDAWKDMNEEVIKSRCISPDILKLPLNLARTNNAHYKNMDGYTNSVRGMKTDVLLVYAATFKV